MFRLAGFEIIAIIRLYFQMQSDPVGDANTFIWDDAHPPR